MPVFKKFLVFDGINHGLMTACAMVNKIVWNTYKFDETLVFSEDKQWSDRVMKAGYLIKDVNETFFYFAKRSLNSTIKRWELETLADCQLKAKSYGSYLKIFSVYFYNVTIKNFINSAVYTVKETKKLNASLRIKSVLKNKNRNLTN